MSKALILAASLKQAEDVHKQIAAAKVHHISFIYPSKLTNEEMTPSALLDDCYELIKNESVDALVSMHPGVDLVHAALVNLFPHLKGPSCESILLCMHKFYSHHATLGTFGLPFATLDLDDLDADKVGSAMDIVGEQAVIKDCLVTHNCMEEKFKSETQFWKDFDRIKTVIESNQQPYEAFLKNYIDKEKYSKAFNTMVYLEKFVESVPKDVNVHLVEACVAEKEFIPWILSDVTYSRHKPRCIDMVSVPTKIDGFIQMQVWGVMREVVQRLINEGFNYHFINATVLSTNGGDVKIADISSCILRENTTLYKLVFQNGDNMRAQLELACLGDVPRTPRALTKKHACRCSVTAFADDVTLGEIIDVKEAKAQNNVDLLVSASESFVLKESDFGTQIVRFCVQGQNNEDCEKAIQSMLKLIVKQPKYTNWASQYDV